MVCVKCILHSLHFTNSQCAISVAIKTFFVVARNYQQLSFSIKTLAHVVKRPSHRFVFVKLMATAKKEKRKNKDHPSVAIFHTQQPVILNGTVVFTEHGHFNFRTGLVVDQILFDSRTIVPQKFVRFFPQSEEDGDLWEMEDALLHQAQIYRFPFVSNESCSVARLIHRLGAVWNGRYRAR